MKRHSGTVCPRRSRWWSGRFEKVTAMRLASILYMRFRSLFSRAKVEQDLDEELRYHLERQIEEDVAAGMSREDARRAALKAFQDLAQRKEECRDMRGWNLIDNLTQDFRFKIGRASC